MLYKTFFKNRDGYEQIINASVKKTIFEAPEHMQKKADTALCEVIGNILMAILVLQAVLVMK